jgi:hypothetical protein
MWWRSETSEALEAKYVIAAVPKGHLLPSGGRYESVRTYQYRNWWPWQMNSVVVLQDREQH